MALQRIDTAFGPNPVRFNGNIQPQANANVFLGNTSFQFSTIYASTFSGTATHANLAYYLGSGTAIEPSSVNVAGNIVGYATTISSNIATGAIVSRGGLGVAGNVYIGGGSGNAIISSGDIYNAGNIWATGATNTGLKTNQTTAYVFNETATTVRIGGAATTLSIGAAGADTLTFQATTGSLIPGANAAVNLGSSTVYWGTVFTGNIVSNAHVIGGGGIVNAGTAVHRSNTQATSTTTGSMQLTGGMSIASGNLYIAGSAGAAIVATGNILPSGNVVSTNNIGSDTTWWNNFYGVSTQARYADLAENYQADADYKPGTVLEFGGAAEVTIAEDGTRRVAGVVSTNPAHLMNGMLRGPGVVPLALQGRTPCKVRGKINKGDMLVSGGNGYARPDSNPVLGTVIGKALEDFDGIDGIIEVVVGRL